MSKTRLLIVLALLLSALTNLYVGFAHDHIGNIVAGLSNIVVLAVLAIL